MSFDTIPEDKRQGFPCDCGGSITKNEQGVWECDECNFVGEDITKTLKIQVQKIGDTHEITRKIKMTQKEWDDLYKETSEINERGF